MSESLQIETFCLGEFMTNCYVVATDTGAAWVVDAGFGPESMLAYLREHQLRVEQVVLTHAHVDHIAGLAQVMREVGDVPILIHEAEKAFLIDTDLNLSIYMGQPIVAPEATGFVKQGDTLTLGSHEFEVRHTPGHSPGGICLYQAAHNVALVGDTLFNGSIGRHDFPTSDFDALQRSIREQLYTLPDDTRVLPGHGNPTTIGHEKSTNPFVRG
jgi:glyoxylase-like metal-dependent hydrolase (beta-lactamase superfamily II)